MRKKGRVFLTGGTGFLGSNLGYELLRLGYEVVFLARGLKGIPLKTRLETPLKVIDPDFNLDQYSYRIMEGDICLPNLGLNAEDLTWLKANKPKSIFHCAGSISFSEKEDEQKKIWEINVTGTKNVIALAQHVGIGHLHYISTAYVAGVFEGVWKEEIRLPHRHLPDSIYEKQVANPRFHNIYERTKFYAELEVAESGLYYTIHRPSIVTGAPNRGVLNPSGYYMCSKLFWRLKKMIQKNLENDPSCYDGTGIAMAGEHLILPVAFERRFKARLNLVPVDWLVKQVVELSEKESCRNKVFHLTHPNPPDIEYVIKNSLDILGINGVKIVDSGVNVVHDDARLNEIQRQVNNGMSNYLPYVAQNLFFSTDYTQLVLNSHYVPPPSIDRAFLEQILNYAIEHNFRR